MKANHLPQEDRLLTRIHKLENAQEAAMQRVKGSFYMLCCHCGASSITVHMDGHHRGCPLRGVEKQIAHYKNLRFISARPQS